MKKLFLVAGLAALAACQKQEAAPAANETADANAAAPAATPAAFQLNETTWTFIDPKEKVPAQESIDANGNYVENAVSGKHLDHGTAVMKGDKACFTSAMTKEGEVCWTTKPTDIGQSLDTVSDKGEKLTVTRVAYVPMSMSK